VYIYLFRGKRKTGHLRAVFSILAADRLYRDSGAAIGFYISFGVQVIKYLYSAPLSSDEISDDYETIDAISISERRGAGC